MKTLMDKLNQHPGLSGWKINRDRKESYELFFVKGELETVRNTDNTDLEVTVYVDHGDFKGNAQFFVYASTPDSELDDLIEEAIAKAKLIDNPMYCLPACESGDHVLPSNFDGVDASELAARIANTVFDSNIWEDASLNAVEIFINRHTETVLNSLGLDKQQHFYTAMVEAIPTCTKDGESVELYEQYNFSSLDPKALHTEISDKLAQARARHDAKRMSITGNPKVILNSQELMELFWNFAYDLNYSSVYSHQNVYSLGDLLQTAPEGDKLGITMAGSLPGCSGSRKFDGDGIDLGRCRIVEDGKAVSYYGSNRFGQYLAMEPTGNLRCMQLDPGSVTAEELAQGPYLEVVSMSGIQTDFYSDYVGGEIRLAYWHDGENIIPVTGVSISGKLSDVLNHIHFSQDCALMGNFYGPKKAILTGMNIF